MLFHITTSKTYKPANTFRKCSEKCDTSNKCEAKIDTGLWWLTINSHFSHLYGEFAIR